MILLLYYYEYDTNIRIIVCLNFLVAWHYSRRNGSDPLCCQIFGRSLRNYDSYVMKIYDMNMKSYMQECWIVNVQGMHMNML